MMNERQLVFNSSFIIPHSSFPLDSRLLLATERRDEMNGLQMLEARASLVDRLLGRKAKERAAIELNNYVATTPLADITAHDVERILAKYKCDHHDLKSALTIIYTQVLNHFAEDKRVSAQEREGLTHLRHVFGLTEAEVEALDQAVLLPLYQAAVREFFADGHFSFKEREQFERLTKNLGQDEAAADELILNEAFNAFEQSAKHEPTQEQTAEKEETGS